MGKPAYAETELRTPTLLQSKRIVRLCDDKCQNVLAYRCSSSERSLTTYVTSQSPTTSSRNSTARIRSSTVLTVRICQVLDVSPYKTESFRYLRSLNGDSRSVHRVPLQLLQLRTGLRVTLLGIN